MSPRPNSIDRIHRLCSSPSCSSPTRRPNAAGRSERNRTASSREMSAGSASAPRFSCFSAFSVLSAFAALSVVSHPPFSLYYYPIKPIDTALAPGKVLYLALRFKRQGFAIVRLSASGKSAPLAKLPLTINHFNQDLVLLFRK